MNPPTCSVPAAPLLQKPHVSMRIFLHLACISDDWLLQLDIDELLYFPRTRERHDARAFFSSVSPAVDAVGFHNHEVYPCEQALVPDWFALCTYFKISPHMQADYAGSANETERAQRLKRASEGEEIDPHAPPPPNNQTGSAALGQVLHPLGAVRSGAMRQLHKLGLTMPGKRTLQKSSSEAWQAANNRRIAGDDEARARMMKRAAQRRDQLQAKPKEGQPQAEPPTVATARSPIPSLGAWPDDSRPDEPDFESAGRLFFSAHAQGKQAVRLRRCFDPPRSAGPHGFESGGRTHTCGGTHDPVVLHYANCGLEYWQRKYAVLGDIPNFEDRQTVEGHQKHRAGLAKTSEKDGEWSPHMAARDLVVRGAGGKAALETFYRTLVMGNEYGEAQHLAACGILVRIPAVAQMLETLRADAKRFRRAGGPDLPPTPPALLNPSRWLTPPRHVPIKTPRRPRLVQWRVIFNSRIVTRSRPNIASPPARIFEPGELLWTGEPRDDGWVVPCDELNYSYVLIDATHLGYSKLLERVDPPELEKDACQACCHALCVCAVLAEYAGRPHHRQHELSRETN